MKNYTTYFKIILTGFLIGIIFHQDLVSQGINKDAQYELNSLNLSGNDFFSSDFLKDLLLTKESPSGFSKFWFSTGIGLGSPTSYYNPQNLLVDVSRIISVYKVNGFASIKVDTSIHFDNINHLVDITIIISEGYQSLIDSVIYLKIDSLDEQIKQNIISNSLLKPKSGYNAELLTKEMKRVIQVVSNSGYPDALIDNKSIKVERFSSTNNVRIIIPLETGPKAFFGNTAIKWEGAKNQNIQEEIIFKQLDYKTGEPYSIEKKIESERNLSHLGIFDYARIESNTLKRDDTTKYRNLSILLKPRDRYELAPEIFVNGEEGFFNVGVGINGIIRNIGGGAQSLAGGTSVRAQSLEKASIEFPILWTQPYFYSNKMALSITTSFGMDFRKEYQLNILESKIGVASKFNKYNFFNFGFFEWNINRTQVQFFVDTLQPMKEIVAEEISKFDKPQFNSIFKITLQHDNTNDIFSPTAGDYLSASIEEAGFFPSFVIKRRSELRYSQFYKITLLGKLFKSIVKDSAIISASKLKIGFAQQYGESQEEYPIPLTERFKAGGGLSIRGWGVEGLSAADDPALGGKIIIESSFELRVHLSKSMSKLLFLDANKIWLVFFTDFGNIWNDFRSIRIADFAVAAGIGFRYDAFFGPIRIDFGNKVYDPFSKGNQWIFNKRFFPEVLSKWQVHFGIAHSF
jgi:outer membrane protein assembly factor BamA